MKFNPFPLVDFNERILLLLNENFGRLKRLLEKGHASDHEKGGADEINVTGLSGVLADKQLSDWQVLAEVEVGENCDYVDFTGLDINRDWEYYLGAIVKNPADSKRYYYLYVEGDYTSSHYYMQAANITGSGVYVGRYNTAEIGWIESGEGSMFNIRITKDPNGYFRCLLRQSRKIGANIELEFRTTTKTAPVSNITSLRVSANASGAIGAGSRFILARLRS